MVQTGIIAKLPNGVFRKITIISEKKKTAFWNVKKKKTDNKISQIKGYFLKFGGVINFIPKDPKDKTWINTKYQPQRALKGTGISPAERSKELRHLSIENNLRLKGPDGKIRRVYYCNKTLKKGFMRIKNKKIYGKIGKVNLIVD